MTFDLAVKTTLQFLKPVTFEVVVNPFMIVWQLLELMTFYLIGDPLTFDLAVKTTLQFLEPVTFGTTVKTT